MKVAGIVEKLKQYPFTIISGKELGTDVRKLRPYFDHLKEDQYLQKLLNLSKPMRKRSMMTYQIEFDDVGHLIRFHEEYKLDEWDAKKTLQYARLYDEFTQELKSDQNFKDFIYNSLQVLWELKKFKEAQITCHAIRTLSYEEQPGKTSPEGMYQLKDDNIEVTALVNKQNCQGATTQIFSKDKSNILFEMGLEPNEGYILTSEELWHYSTDHTPLKPTEPCVRDLIGYLLKIKS